MCLASKELMIKPYFDDFHTVLAHDFTQHAHKDWQKL
jgi:hypothetical protein